VNGSKLFLMEVGFYKWKWGLEMEISDVPPKKTVREQVRERLLAGEPYKEILDSTKSKSAFYQGRDDAFDILGKRYADLNSKYTKLKQQVESLEREKAPLIEEVKDLNSRKKALDKLEAEIKEKTEVLEQMRALTDKGIPFPFIKQLYEMDVKNEKEIFSRIETFEVYERLKADLTSSKVSLDKLDKRVTVLTTKEAQAKKALMSTREAVKSRENELNKVEARLKILKGEEEGVKNVLSTYGETVIANLDKTLITMVASTTKEWGEFNESMKADIKKVSMMSVDAVKNIRKESTSFLKTQKQFHDGFNRLKAEAREYEGQMEFGSLVFGLQHDPESIAKLPLTQVVWLARWLHIYTVNNHPNFPTWPSEEVYKESSGQHFTPFIPEYRTVLSGRGRRLTALTKWILETFERIELEAVASASSI